MKRKPSDQRTILAGSWLVLLYSLAVMSGCQVFAKGVDASQDLCKNTLAKLPEVIREASIRGVPVGQLVDLFCAAADVAAVFTESGDETRSATSETPAVRALSLLRAKGEIR